MKRKEPIIDDVIRDFIRVQQRLEKQTGGYLEVVIRFGPKPKATAPEAKVKA